MLHMLQRARLHASDPSSAQRVRPIDGTCDPALGRASV